MDDAPGVYVLSCAGVVKGRLHRGGIAGFVSPKRLVDFFAAEWADVVVRYDTWMAVQRIREAKGTIGNAGDESADAKGTVHADARKEKERSVSEERIEQARVTEKPPRDGPLTVKLPATGMSLPRPRESRLRARLPSGECITCTYPSSTKFGEIRTWICGASALAPGRVHIASHVPRHVYGMGDDEKMISELGLEPSAVLVVTKGEEGAVVGLGFGMERGRGFVWAVWEYLRGIFMAVLKAFNVGNERGRGVMTFERRAEGERGRGRGEVDEDELRFNGNGTQFGYDPNVDDRR